MSESEPDASNHQIKALFGSTPPLPDKTIEKQRRATIKRARASVGQRDTVMFAFIKMWTVLADMLAPIFATFASKNSMAIKTTSKTTSKPINKPTKINKKTK